MNPEREKLIRELADGDFGLMSGSADISMGKELFAEINRLRNVIQTISDNEERLRLENNNLRYKLDEAEKKIDELIDGREWISRC